MRKLWLAVVWLVGSLSVEAQTVGVVYKQNTDIVVSKNNKPVLSAWCGGFNNMQIAQADLNQDSKLDLVVYDFYLNVVRTFLNIGIAGEVKYLYTPYYEKNFKMLDNYILLRDYNCDGISDLFTKGSPGVTVYKGSYDAGELKFTLYKSLWYPGPLGQENVYVQPSDVPSIEDTDGDGDLDVYSYEVNGFYLTYYKNMQVENGLPCDTMRMVLADKCWGKFYQGAYRSVLTGITCKGGSTSNKKYRHPKNTVLHIDIDNDGDWDVLNGNGSFSDIQLLYNNGNNLITNQDTTFNSNDHKIKMPTWPVASLLDIDNDNDKDLLFASHSSDYLTANYKTIDWYKNIGTSSTPLYTYFSDTLLMKDIIDVGTGSYPTFFDYDRDGKKDLFIGNEGLFDNVADTMSYSITYYRNTSTTSAPQFEWVTDDFLNLRSKKYPGIAPTFGDITGDDIDDLLFGTMTGKFVLYKNMAASNSVQPIFQLATDSLPIPFAGKYSTPLIFDWNFDGRNDLISGNQQGTLVLFQDTSLTTTSALKLITTTLGDVKVGDPGSVFSYSAPTISTLDNTSKLYLLVGTLSGTIERYDSFINKLTQYKKLDSFYSGIQAPARAIPTIYDVEGDGKKDLVVGNPYGGLLLYKETILSEVSNTAKGTITLYIYPNPSNGEFYVQSLSGLHQEVLVECYNLYGERILAETLILPRASISLADQPSGIYLMRIRDGAQASQYKLIKQ
jgi:hypothetical protein